jgi:DNA repair protein RAD51/nuclear pore complex protein Nup160
MAKIRAPYLYTETRLHLDQAHANSTIDISLSKTGNHDRRLYNDVHIGSDETHFTRAHLSTEASLFFRSDERCPRSFLWRLLDDRRVLEIQAVDLSQDLKQKNEAILTLLLRFPAAVRPFCIAFADAEEKDALSVFAVTTSDELWTLTLARDVFVHAKNSETLAMDWCKVTKPSMFAVTTPFRLFASTARELFVSMKDGQVVRLTRKSGEDGSKWHDAVYAEGSWGTSFLKWRSGPTVKFGDLDLEPSAAVAIAPTSFDEDDAHLITVCLNHTLRIWNLKTGRISAELDILGEEDQKYFIAANQRQLLQLVDMPGRQEQYVVTYSPKHHQFKFWAIFDAEAGRQGIREMRPGMDYKPPVETLMDTAVWNMEEFHLRPSRGAKQTELWIRVRSGQSSQLFMLSFDPFDFGHKLHEVSSQYVKACWEQDWVAVAPGRQTLDALDKLSPTETSDLLPGTEVAELTERWVQFLFYPGRFTMPLLETALETFLVASGRNLPSSTREPLKDRIVKAIWSSAAKPGAGRRHSVDYDAKARWQSFYGIVRDLHKRGSDAVAFVMDPYDQIPWLVAANGVAPIREASQIEKIEANAEIVHALPTPKLAFYSFAGAEDDDKSEAVDAEDESIAGNLYLLAHNLRSLLPSSFQSTFRRAITEDLTTESSKSVAERIHDLKSETSLLEELSEEDNDKFDDVVKEFGGYQAFHTDVFVELLDKLLEPEQGRHQDEIVTRYGSKLAIRIAQETVALNTEVLLDLLATLLYLEGSFELEELVAAINGLPEDTVDTMQVDEASPVFDVPFLFEKIMNLLRENIILDFLTSNIRKERTKPRRKSSIGDSPVNARAAGEVSAAVYASTLLQSIFIGDWKDVRAPEEDMSAAQMLTYHTRAWLTKLEVGQYESFTAHVLADLVKHGDVDLAETFLRFVPVTGWSGYLRGRLFLERNDYEQAAEWFREAADAMGMQCHFWISAIDMLTPLKLRNALTLTIAIRRSCCLQTRSRSFRMGCLRTTSTS